MKVFSTIYNKNCTLISRVVLFLSASSQALIGPFYLDSSQLSLYYFCLSILSLQAIAEMGLGKYIYIALAGQNRSQFIHSNDQSLSLNSINLESRELIKKSAQQILYTSLAFFVFASIYGFIILALSKNKSLHTISVDQSYLYILLSTGLCAIMLNLSFYISIMEALVGLKEAANTRIIAAISSVSALIIVIAKSKTIFAFNIATIMSCAVIIFCFLRLTGPSSFISHYKFFLNTFSTTTIKSLFDYNINFGILSEKVQNSLSRSFKLRISVSCLCGYIIFQYSNAFVFLMSGSKLSSIYGFILSLVSLVTSLAMSPSHQNIPLYTLAFQKSSNSCEIYKIYHKSLLKSIAIYFLLCISAFSVLNFADLSAFSTLASVKNYNLCLAIYFISGLLNLFTFIQADLVRSRLTDPYFRSSIVLALIVLMGLPISYTLFGFFAPFLISFVTSLIGLLISRTIFSQFKLSIHANAT